MKDMSEEGEERCLAGCQTKVTEPKTEGFSADKTLSRHIMSDLGGTPQ